MKIEVDQSEKLEQTSRDTVIAFSNGEQYSILIESGLKQNLFRNRKSKLFKLKLFAVCLYLLLKDKIEGKELIVIDEEYSGNDIFIKDFLLRLIRKSFPDFDRRSIIFGRVTKKSNAHDLALLVYRKKLMPNKIIKEEEILELLK